MVLSTYPRIWLGVFDYFVRLGFKGLIYMYIHVCFHICSVLSCFVCSVCILYVYICTHLCVCIFVYVYIHVCSSVYIYASLYVCVGTYFCLYKGYLFSCLSCGYLGCYLSVWHCYLGNILAFSFQIVNLNTTTCTKSSTQVIKMNLGNMNSWFPNLIVSNSGCMYLFIWINSNWLIDWLIDWID